jgi:hypothetical protein
VPVNRSLALSIVHTSASPSTTRPASYALGPSLPKYWVK